jgi:hypothetical protein
MNGAADRKAGHWPGLLRDNRLPRAFHFAALRCQLAVPPRTGNQGLLVNHEDWFADVDLGEVAKGRIAVEVDASPEPRFESTRFDGGSATDGMTDSRHPQRIDPRYVPEARQEKAQVGDHFGCLRLGALGWGVARSARPSIHISPTNG